MPEPEQTATPRMAANGEDSADSARTIADLRFLVEAGAVLSSSLDYFTTFRRLAELVVPRLADWCAIEMVVGDGSLQRLATTHSDPAKAELALRLDREYPPDPNARHGAVNVARTGKTETVNDISDEMLRSATRSDDHFRIIKGLGLCAYMCVPLVARGHILGVISLVQAESVRQFRPQDVVLVEELAARAALAMDNARLYSAAQAEIAQRRRAETARNEGEHLLATTLRSIGDAVIATDPAGIVIFMNGVAETLTGWREADAIGRHSREVFRIINEQTRLEVHSPIDHVLRDGVVVGLANHTVVVARDGREYPIEDSGAPIRDEEGRLLGVVLVFHDVTKNREQEQAVREGQEQLRQSEVRFRLLVEQSPLSIQILDPTGRTIQVNRAWEELWGVTVDALSDYNMLEDRQLEEKGILPFIRRAFAGEPVAIPRVLYDPNRTLEVRSSRPDSSRWTEAVMFPVKDESGLIREVVLIHKDVTEQVQAVRASAHLAAIVASSTDAIVSKDLDGIVTSWNPAAERIYGYTADEIIGKSKSVLMPAELPDELPSVLSRIKAGEVIHPYDTVRIRKDATRVNLSVSVSPVRDGSGAIIGASTIARDITERVQYLAEIEDLNTRLKRSIQETHHRVKNNLQVISALVEVQMDAGDATVPAAAMHRIGQHTRSLAAIHDLLTQQVKIDPNVNTISTTDAMEKLIPLLQATAGGREIRYEVDEVQLPVRAGASLALLVSEIVSNAVKHGRGTIELSLTANAESIRLEVSDQGPGFPPGFEWRSAANTGLSLIDSAGRFDFSGDVTYENRPEGGARVVVTFPVTAIQWE